VFHHNESSPLLVILAWRWSKALVIDGAYILHAGLYSNGVSRQALALLQVYNSQLMIPNISEWMTTLNALPTKLLAYLKFPA
jgi:hypothetical protein